MCPCLTVVVMELCNRSPSPICNSIPHPLLEREPAGLVARCVGSVSKDDSLQPTERFEQQAVVHQYQEQEYVRYTGTYMMCTYLYYIRYSKWSSYFVLTVLIVVYSYMCQQQSCRPGHRRVAFITVVMGIYVKQRSSYSSYMHHIRLT